MAKTRKGVSMKRKILLVIVGIFFFFGFLSVLGTRLFGEDLTITTYYPAPYGVYKDLKSETLLYDPIAGPPPIACAAGTKGTTYYDEDDDEVLVCNGISWNPMMGDWPAGSYCIIQAIGAACPAGFAALNPQSGGINGAVSAVIGWTSSGTDPRVIKRPTTSGGTQAIPQAWAWCCK